MIGRRIGTTGDAAQRLEVSNAWVLRGFVARGLLPPLARTIGGLFLFDMEDVDVLREERRAQRQRRKRGPVVVSS
jgi:hypothetical protein